MEAPDAESRKQIARLREEIRERVYKIAGRNAQRIASDTAHLVRFVRESNWKAAVGACFWLARQADIQIDVERLSEIFNRKGGLRQ